MPVQAQDRIMNVQSLIERKLVGAIDFRHLEIINESANHNVPPGSESHFKLIMVADAFDNKPLLARHRLINEVLRDELAGPIHALAIHAYTAAEWQERNGDAPLSPPCLGGGK